MSYHEFDNYKFGMAAAGLRESIKSANEEQLYRTVNFVGFLMKFEFRIKIDIFSLYIRGTLYKKINCFYTIFHFIKNIIFIG